MSSEPVKRSPNGGVQLIQLVYRSTSTTGVASALQMSDILAEARPRNAELGITGALTAVNGEFVQIIEGPEPGLDVLLAKLVRDRRHTDLRVLERRSVATRAFAEWDMVSPRLAGLQTAQVALLLADDGTGIDDFISVLKQAITRQDAILEGVESPVEPTTTLASRGFFIERTTSDPDA